MLGTVAADVRRESLRVALAAMADADLRAVLPGIAVPRFSCGASPIDAPPDRGALDLIETRTFGSRVIYERYRRVRDELE